MRKKILVLTIFLTAVFLLSSCDDITRNFNIFSIFNTKKTTEEKLDTASYYMEKGSKSGYNKAMNIYQKIIEQENEPPYNADARYGYATAYARYHEIEQNVVGMLPQVMGLIADLQSADPVILFERLYADAVERKEKQLASFDISVEVSETLYDIAMDKENEPSLYYGRIKSEDIWLDAALAYIYRCGSTITTHNGDARDIPASVFELVWNPIQKVMEISAEGLAVWVAKEVKEQDAIIEASTDSLGHAIDIIALHTGAEELTGLKDQLDMVNVAFDELISFLKAEAEK